MYKEKLFTTLFFFLFTVPYVNSAECELHSDILRI